MSSEKTPAFRAGAPWYRNGEYYRFKAGRYLRKVPIFDKRPEHNAQLQSSVAFNRARLVFESNLIEGAGLESEGETRKLIEEHFPALPKRPQDYPPLLGERGDSAYPPSRRELRKLKRMIRSSGLGPKEVVPSISFADQPRAYREVLQHYQALDYANHLRFDWHLSVAKERIMDTIRSIYENDPKMRDEELRIFRSEFNKQRIRHRRLLTHTSLKQLHHVLAHGLMPVDAGVPAGEYRVDNRSVGWDISFPAPELVRASMSRFISDSDGPLTDLAGPDSKRDLFQTAAEISYHFVRIHPFPDFNGRLSRIIMNMVLDLGGNRIPIALRGDGKGRKRYFTALRHANRGQMDSLSALIAMRTVETFEEIDKNLELAGQPTIWSIDAESSE